MLSIIACLTFASTVLADTSPEVSVGVHFTNTSDIILSDPLFKIACNNCSVDGDLSISGGWNDIDDYPDANFSSLPFDYTDIWIGAVMEDFVAVFDLNFTLTPNASTNEFDVPLLAPLFPNGFGTNAKLLPGFDMAWYINPTLHGWVNSSKPVNFTYGFELTIPANSAVWVPIAHLDNVTAIGFNESSLTPLNYTSIDPNDDFTFELGFRLCFSISGTIVSDNIAQAELYTDIPKFDINVTQVFNVTSDCQPATSTTAADLIFRNLTLVSPSISFDLGYDFDVGPYDGSEVDTLGNVDSLPTSCLYYSPKLHELDTVPSKPPSSGGVWLRAPMVASIMPLLLAVVMI